MNERSLQETVKSTLLLEKVIFLTTRHKVMFLEVSLHGGGGVSGYRWAGTSCLGVRTPYGIGSSERELGGGGGQETRNQCVRLGWPYFFAGPEGEHPLGSATEFTWIHI